MCYHTKVVKIKNSNKTIRVNCGHCPACMMEKAIRHKNMIDNHLSNGNVYIFFTLHYSNSSCPYVYLDDIQSKKVITVYRDSFSYKATSKFGKVRQKKTFGLCELGEKVNETFVEPYTTMFSIRISPRKDTFYKARSLQTVKEVSYYKVPTQPLSKGLSIKTLNRYDKDKVGVLWYPDIKNFFKRLKINLQRYYGFDYTDGYFYCGEYGPTTYRPHFHGLVACKPENAEIVKNTIVASWPYGSAARTRQYCQIAYEASSYVSSYVNGTLYLPDFLQQKSFAPKTAHSKFFGCGLDAFSAKTFYKNAEQGNVTYDAISIKDQVPVHIAVPYPSRVLRRFLPRCKGFSKLTDDEVYLLYSGLRQVEDFDYKLWHRTPFSYYHGYFSGDKSYFERSIVPYFVQRFHTVEYDANDVLHKKPKIRYSTDVPCTVDELFSFKHRLSRARSLYKSVTGKSDLDFGLLVRDFYRKRSSELYKSVFNDLLPSQYLYAYDNNEILLDNSGIAPTLEKYITSETRFGANNNPLRCEKSFELTKMHESAVKKSKVTDFLVDQITFN